MTTDLLCNDKHSKLNPTHVAEIHHPSTEEKVITLIQKAASKGQAVSLCGARHAMGGQQFGNDTLLLDLSHLTQLHPIDLERGLVEVDSGMMWLGFIEGLHAQQEGNEVVWSIRQKQTGADDLTLGGSLAANIHGRGLQLRPIINDVEAFTLIDGEGKRHRCSREENEELFRLVIGGYGCFGVITSIQMRLTPRQKVERIVEVTTMDQVIPSLEARIADGYLFGDFQFAIDETSSDFLNRGVLSCYRPIDSPLPILAAQNKLGKQDWAELIGLAHTDRSKAFQAYSEFYLSTHKSRYWSDTHQLSVYLEDYHSKIDHDCGAEVPASEMITELYVPRKDLTSFMKDAAALLKDGEVPVIYGTVRLIERDEESYLAWARENFACVIFNLHTEHDEKGIARSSEAFQALIDLALKYGGSYYLTYHRWARLDQIKKAHPRLPEFLAAKERYDPTQRFQSEWWRHHRSLFLKTRH